jgi:hypothetical protein
MSLAPCLIAESLPEELLERILVLTPLSFIPTPVFWHTCSSSSQRSPSTLAPLLVSRLFNRIGTPILYHTIVIRSPVQARNLVSTLQVKSSYGTAVKRLMSLGSWDEVAPIIHFSPRLDYLDLTLDGRGANPTHLCNALPSASIKHLVLRKPTAYLSQAKPRFVIANIAVAIPAWVDLEVANIAFRLSDDSPMSPLEQYIPQGVAPTTPAFPILHALQSPNTALALSLSMAPNLHTLHTQLPSIWNPLFLLIADNARLERVVFGGTVPGSNGYLHSRTGSESGDRVEEREGVLETGLFMTEARKWPRLRDIIRAGT